MAIGSNLPPQAYTRETLTVAFNWLQTQPESVKRLAPNPDALVALYMRSQRYGTGETEAPVSSQNFISDLKHLAEGLKQFDQPEVPTPSPRAAIPPSVVLPKPATTVPAAPALSPVTSHAVILGTPQKSWAEALHPTSQVMVAQIKDMFNLTSETEAVNMMIAVAHKSLKNLI